MTAKEALYEAVLAALRLERNGPDKLPLFAHGITKVMCAFAECIADAVHRDLDAVATDGGRAEQPGQETTEVKVTTRSMAGSPSSMTFEVNR